MKHDNIGSINELKAFKRFLIKELGYIEGNTLKKLIDRFIAQLDDAELILETIYAHNNNNVINLNQRRKGK